MYSIDTAQTFIGRQDSCWFGAYRSVFDAIASLEDAGAALLALSGDTRWHSDGMRSLNTAIDGIAGSCGTEANGLRTRLWELEAADG